jgi:hypothetical protein
MLPERHPIEDQEAFVSCPLALALETFVGDGTKAAGCVKLLLVTTHGVLLAVYWRFWQGQLLP